MVGKRGWIRVVEAFVAVLLIGGVILLSIGQDDGEQSTEISSGVYEDQMTMLGAVQSNDTLRNSIIGISEASLPLDTDDSGFPQNVEAKLEEKNPGYMTCDAKICLLEQECLIENTDSSDVYVSQAAIFSNLQTYSPRKLVLSCVLND